jgi:hypothetical protein
LRRLLLKELDRNVFCENAMCPKAEVGVVMRDDGAFASPSSSPELGLSFLVHFNNNHQNACIVDISHFPDEFLQGPFGRWIMHIYGCR